LAVNFSRSPAMRTSLAPLSIRTQRAIVPGQSSTFLFADTPQHSRCEHEGRERRSGWLARPRLRRRPSSAILSSRHGVSPKRPVGVRKCPSRHSHVAPQVRNVLAEMCPKCGNPGVRHVLGSAVADSQHRLMTSTAARGAWDRPA